ncbi:MAG: glycine cleavage system protein GcvH [Ignavibacteria bacterium]|nr:glycine cleavage system protein GcvH [Bacteroidota bacterium]MSQ46132.1 glycine cleavage system protein GcvH [Ignavibacteria bacterium]
MNFPNNLKYTKEHEWIKIDGEIATVGITEYAQGELGDIVYLDLPKIGQKVNHGSTFGTIEAVKAVSDLYSPVEGEVVEVNQNLNSSPELVNKFPYEDGWMIKIKISATSNLADLLDSDSYKLLIGK